MTVWLNGRCVPSDQAQIAPDDRGFLLGDGVFETLLAVNGKIIDGETHLVRLHQGTDLLELGLPYTDDTLLEAMAVLLADNELRHGRASIRLTVSRGSGPRGLLYPDSQTPTCLITAARAGPPLTSMRVITSDVVRNEHSPLTAIKSLNYLDNILARRQAQKAGADEALMRNTQGRIACASAANIWAIVEDMFITPPTIEGALAGITRDRVCDILAQHNIAFTEAPISQDVITSASGLFLTNSLIGICPIQALDGRDLMAPDVLRHVAEAYGETLT